VTPSAAHAHPHFAELFALLRRQDFLDFCVRGLELTVNLGLNAGHHGIDAGVMLVNDSLHVGSLLRCQIELAVETLDDPPRHELPERWPPAVKEIEVISGDSDEYAANERCHHHQGSSRPRLTR